MARCSIASCSIFYAGRVSNIGSEVSASRLGCWKIGKHTFACFKRLRFFFCPWPSVVVGCIAGLWSFSLFSLMLPAIENFILILMAAELDFAGKRY